MKSTIMKHKSDEFERLKKVDSVLYRFITDFRPDVISGTSNWKMAFLESPIKKPSTPDFKQIVHEILRADFKLMIPAYWYLVPSIRYQFENPHQ